MQKSGHMVLKGVNWVNWVHNDKIRSNGLERSQLGYTMEKSGYMVLRTVNWVCNDKIRSDGLERKSIRCTNEEIRSYGLERSQFGTECKNQVKWS